MLKLRPKSQRRVAFAATCVLLLSTLMSAWATGAMAAVPMVDQFGNPICLTSGDYRSHGGGPAGDQTKLPNCCTLGCSMVYPLLAAPSADASAWLIERRDLADATTLSFATIFVPFPDHDPGSPRAPPLTA